MTREEAIHALEVGIHMAEKLVGEGYGMLATGEMGIGNTTTSSAVASVLLHKPVEEITGRGAGLSGEGLKKKISVIKQAIDMSGIHLNILSGTMDAFASIISNNLNIVMKVLASITLIISIPTVISGIYGMNVDHLPFANFWFPVGVALGLMAIAFVILRKKQMI